MSGCNCCITQEQIFSMVKSALWAEMTAGHLQAPLLACDGTTLGAAKVPTCDLMSMAITDAVKRMQPVIHDTTLSGYGSCQSPLTVNTSWLKAWLLDFADNNALVHAGGQDGGITGAGTVASPFTIYVNHDTSLTGIGTKADPLALNAHHDGSLAGIGTEADPLKLVIQHDGSLDGTGAEGDPLKVDGDWLNTQIKNYVDGNGVHVAPDAGIAGTGSADAPLSLNTQHDDSLAGIGTNANELKVNTDWLNTQISNYINNNGGGHAADDGGIVGNGSTENPYKLDIRHDDTLTGKGTAEDPLGVNATGIFKPDTALSPASSIIVPTDSVATIIVGGQEQTLGKPSAYIKVGNYVVPAYAA